jgi:hypothetical protein
MSSRAKLRQGVQELQNTGVLIMRSEWNTEYRMGN